MTTRRFIFATFVLASSACGRDLVLLHVTSSELSVPADVNTLRVTTSAQSDAPTPLLVQSMTLTDNDPFPIDVLLRIDDKVPHQLHHEVEALFGDEVVESASVDGTWKDHNTEHLTVSLDDSAE